MSNKPTLTWMMQGSPDVSGDFAKNWKNEKTRSKHRFYHTVMSAVYFFVREAVQNMKDAWSNEKFRSKVSKKSKKFKITARFVTYHKDSCRNLLKALGIDDDLDNLLASQSPFADSSDAKSWEEYKKSIKHIRKNNSITVLYMEEHDASGMFLDLESQRDGLLAALYSHNQGNPQARAGGSFGHGKGALAKASKLRTNIAYTNTDWCDGSSGMNRLMGAVYMPSFQTKSNAGQQRYSGFGLLVAGTKTDKNVNGVIPVPFEGAAADVKAKELGMRIRGAGDHGTTMMIVEPDFTPDSLNKTSALYWLPALLGGSLEIEIVEESVGLHNEQQAVSGLVDPITEPALTGFCAAQKLLESGVLTDTEKLQMGVAACEVYAKPEIGRLAIVATNYSSVVVDGNHALSPQVVFSRSRGIGLVIAHNHKRGALPQGLDVRAHFQAAANLEELLRSSEPKAHDEWSKDELSSNDKKTIKIIEDHINDSIADFLQKLRGNQSQEAKMLEVASEAWNKIGNQIGKKSKEKKKRPGGGGGSSLVRLEVESEGLDNNNNAPILNVKVSADKDARVVGILHVIDDSGRKVASFDAPCVEVPAGSQNKIIKLVAQDTGNGVIALSKAVDEKYLMSWEVSSYAGAKQADGV